MAEMRNMDMNKIVGVLISLIEEQEKVKIEYELVKKTKEELAKDTPA